MKNYNCNLGGFLGILTILFIGLKLTHYIDWGWGWILAPVWIPLVAVILFLFLILIGMAFWDGH